MKKYLYVLLVIIPFHLQAERNPFAPLVEPMKPRPVKSLEDVSLQTITLKAILWGTDRNMAVFETPEGKTFTATVGTRVGKKDGKVTRIDDNIVVIAGSFGKVTYQFEDQIK
ncbi:MAG: pilus assembly protein PilP [Deltaproteobacteria bacterium]|nr:pilus assembly protein PilP [Deltaproteobacteria bacterium]